MMMCRNSFDATGEIGYYGDMTIETREWLDGHGVATVPIVPSLKRPIAKAWGLRDFADYEWQVYDKAAGGRVDANVGTLVGPRSDWLCSVDLDIPADLAEKVFTIYEPLRPLVVERGGAIRHIQFKLNGRDKKHQYKVGKETIHCDDGKIEWLMGGYTERKKPKQMQAVVYGTHPCGDMIDYRERLDDIPYVHIDFAYLLFEESYKIINGE